MRVFVGDEIIILDEFEFRWVHVQLLKDIQEHVPNLRLRGKTREGLVTDVEAFKLTLDANLLWMINP